MADLGTNAHLSSDQPVLVAAANLFGYLWSQVWLHASGTAAGDADALHDMRVAIRRLRSALQNLEGSSDSPILGREMAREFAKQRRRLAKLGDALGAVRDYDVLDEYLLTYARSHQIELTSQPGLAQFRRYLHNERATAFAPMVKRITRSQQPHKLREQFARWALGLPAASGPAVTWREAASIIIPQRIDAILEQAPLLAAVECEGHHELRKQLRRLRYALEVMGVCFNEHPKAQLKLLVQGQDLLGEMQDRSVLRDNAIRAFASDVGAGELPEDVATFLRWGEMRRRRLLGQSRRWWRDKGQSGLLEISAQLPA